MTLDFQPETLWAIAQRGAAIEFNTVEKRAPFGKRDEAAFARIIPGLIRDRGNRFRRAFIAAGRGTPAQHEAFLALLGFRTPTP